VNGKERRERAENRKDRNAAKRALGTQPRPFGPKPAPKVRQAPGLLGPGKFEIKASSAEGAAEMVALLSRAISFLSATRQLQDFVEFFVGQRHHR
jgi:hypothetical protein